MRKIRYLVRRRMTWVPRPVKRAIITVIGGTVLSLGLVMIIAPGPAFLVVPLGLAILAIEFVWARRWLRRLKRRAEMLRGKARRSTPPATLS